MTRVVLIRPGSTDYDDQDRIQGVLDVPLNARGVEQAAQVAEELRDQQLRTIYSSAEESASETAMAIAQALDIRYRKLEKLRNLDHGLWQGLQVGEVRRKHPRVYRQWCEAPTTVCPPGGETVMDAYQRVERTLKSIIKRRGDEVVGLVVSEPLATIVRCYLRHADIARLWDHQSQNGRWEMVDVAPEGAKTTQEPGPVS